MGHITIQRCKCGHPACSDYWLVGIGKFVQGSGFSKEEAENIAKLLNEQAQAKHDAEVVGRQL